MIALLLDIWEWLRSEATSLRYDVSQKLNCKWLSRRRLDPTQGEVSALSDLASNAAEGKTRRKPSSGAVTIKLSPSDCLRRPLTSIRLRASHLRAMADLDVATTPIDRSDVVILFEQSTATSSDNAYFVVRREAHAALRQAIQARGRVNVQVIFIEDGRTYPLDPGTDRTVGTARRLLMYGMAAAALVSAGGVATDTYLGIAVAKGRLSQEIARHDDEVAVIRQARERIALLEQTRQSLDRTVLARRNPAEVLDALADALPDHTWLTDIRLTGAIIEIAGISTAPMELPSLITASETFDKASFQGNVVKAVNEDGERFSIRMEVSR